MTTAEYNNLITSPFSFSDTYIATNAYTTYSCIEDHNILNGYICIDINHNSPFEVPIAMLPYLKIILAQPEIKWKQIAMPLYYGDTITKTAFNTIIKLFFKETPIDTKRLFKVETRNGEVYYGGNGMIFDKHMEPLVLYTITVTNMTPVSILDKIIRVEAETAAFNVRVSPQIFLRNGVFERNIIKKVIPSLTSKSFTDVIGMILNKPITPKVIIEDLSEWIKRPAKVGSPQTFKEDMQKFLSREDIIQEIIECL